MAGILPHRLKPVLLKRGWAYGAREEREGTKRKRKSQKEDTPKGNKEMG
jgi:hypothetical protein